MSKKVRITVKDAIDDYGIDFESVYYRRIGGASWASVSGDLSDLIIKRLTKEWCVEQGIDPESVEKKNIDYGIISDPRRVDKGRVKALSKAGWKAYDVAVDCHCTEECVEVILNEV